MLVAQGCNDFKLAGAGSSAHHFACLRLKCYEMRDTSEVGVTRSAWAELIIKDSLHGCGLHISMNLAGSGSLAFPSTLLDMMSFTRFF
jgi:hypothetical protein